MPEPEGTSVVRSLVPFAFGSAGGCIEAISRTFSLGTAAVLQVLVSVLSLVGKGVSGRGVKGDIGMSLFKDCFASGVEGTSEEAVVIVDVRDVNESVSFNGGVSSVIFDNKGSTPAAFKLLPDLPIASKAEDVSFGRARNLAKGVDIIRNLRPRSFEGECERERFGDGGGFLRSIRGISLKHVNKGTDWALPFSPEIPDKRVDEVELRVTVEAGLLVAVAERFLVERLLARTSESERLRVCLTVELR